MKSLILILFLIPALCNGQSCPPGQTYFKSIASGDVYIMADKCLLDSTVSVMWDEYFKNLSPRDTTTQNYYTTYRILTIGLGSFVTEVYQYKTSTGWVEISKCLWYWSNKSRLKCYGGYNNTVEIPCCNHFHKIKPL